MPRLTRREFVDLSLQVSLGTGIISLVGCGSGSSDSTGTTPPPPPPGGTLITTDARVAAVTSVSSHFASLPHSSLADDNQRMLSYLASNTAFSASGTQPGGSVWARFTDGTPLVVVNDGSVTANSALARSANRAALTSSPTELPTGKKAFLANNVSVSATVDGVADALLGNLVGIAFNQLGAELGNTGYAVSRLPGSVASLKTITSADLLYLYAHMGIYVSPAGAIVFGLSTTTPLLDTTGAAIDLPTYNTLVQDITNGNIGFMLYTDYSTGMATPVLKPYYMILPPFISTYMSFSSESFVLVNGCNAYSTAFGPTSNVLAAFLLANAGVFASWDQAVNGTEALLSGQMLIEGMAGQLIPSGEPRVRPFAYPDMLTYMHSQRRSGQGYGYDQSSGASGLATLQVVPAKTGEVVGLLAPSIEYLEPTEGTLTIYGSFGDGDPGSVTIGGQSASVQSWSAGRILCVLPSADQAGGAGAVVVTVNGIKSNAVALTAWQMTFHYSVSYDSSSASTQFDTLSGSYTLTATLQVWLRADIHKGRAAPGDIPPAAGIVTDLNGLSLPTKMAKLTAYGISGTITHTVHTGDSQHPVDKTVLETSQPDGSAPYPYDGTSSVLPTQASAFSLISRTVSAATGSLKFFLRAVLPTYTTMLSDTTILGVAAFAGILSSQGLGPGGDGTITMSFDANGNISGGSAPPNGAATLSWDGASPSGGSAPDPTAAC